MTRTTSGVCAAALFGFAVAAGAQQTIPPPTSGSQPPLSSDRAGRDLNVTGCLAKGSDGGFMLTNARIDPAGSASTTGASTATTGTTAAGTTTAGTTTAGTSGTTATTAGTSGSTSPAGSGTMDSASTWSLSGGSDLDKHVGHKVQVTGRAAAPSAAASTETTTATTTTTTSPASAGLQKLEVQSVKMIAASCS